MVAFPSDDHWRVCMYVWFCEHESMDGEPERELGHLVSLPLLYAAPCFLRVCSALDHFYGVFIQSERAMGSLISLCLSLCMCIYLSGCLGYMIRANGMAVPLPNFDQTDAGVTAFTD